MYFCSVSAVFLLCFRRISVVFLLYLRRVSALFLSCFCCMYGHTLIFRRHKSPDGKNGWGLPLLDLRFVKFRRHIEAPGILDHIGNHSLPAFQSVSERDIGGHGQSRVDHIIVMLGSRPSVTVIFCPGSRSPGLSILNSILRKMLRLLPYSVIPDSIISASVIPASIVPVSVIPADGIPPLYPSR